MGAGELFNKVTGFYILRVDHEKVSGHTQVKCSQDA